jgi:hypothetical protein
MSCSSTFSGIEDVDDAAAIAALAGMSKPKVAMAFAESSLRR